MKKQFITVGKKTDLEPGTGMSVELRDIGLALFNVDGTIYAMDNTCPHAGGPLGEGPVEGNVVACPWHGWKFDIQTGTCLKNPNESWRVPTFEVRETDGLIQVLLPESEEKAITISHQSGEVEPTHGVASDCSPPMSPP